MREYVTDAVVLEKTPLRDFDARYSFTKRFGKIAGKATSARKVTSKLAGHLEPGTLTQVRFVERNGENGNGTQITDALKSGKLALSVGDLHFLNAMLGAGEPDATLWEAITADRFSWQEVLRILGWDPRGASCGACGKKAGAFFIPQQEFFCTACALKLDPHELLLLGNAQV